MRPLASLRRRLFVASALLATVPIAVAVFVVDRQVTAQAEVTLHRGLEHASDLVGQWQVSLSENVQLAARLVADAPALKAAIDTGDPQTVMPIAQQHQREARGDLLVVVDQRGTILARAGRLAGDRLDIPIPVGPAAIEGSRVRYLPHSDGVLQIVFAPVSIGSQVIGTVAVGFLLDRARAVELRRLTDTEILFAADGRVASSSLPPGDHATVATALPRAGIWQITLGRNDYVGLSRPLAERGSSRAVAVLLQSRTERLRFLSQIHRALLATAILAVVGAVLLSYLVARTVTRPLGVIIETMREVSATGDLSRKARLPAGPWVDEDARVMAATFNSLTDSLAVFEREAAQRERLSGLGRMSTVIAHEIRNPLMIIKASLRALRGPSFSPDAVREAVTDIGGEVDRLNRLVTEVLDFARPIRFELTSVDLVALCREAVSAASVGPEGPEIRIEDSPGPVTLVTDQERVRLALVNLLTNARQAVQASQDAGPAGSADATRLPLVTLALHAPAEGRVSLEIRDQGVGIPAALMSRVFDPYVTTRRGGTGIGLAISRNIVEGLGGSITLESEEGRGTRVRLVLPLDSTLYCRDASGASDRRR